MKEFCMLAVNTLREAEEKRVFFLMVFVCVCVV